MAGLRIYARKDKLPLSKFLLKKFLRSLTFALKNPLTENK